VQAFRRWITREQRAANIELSERILIQQIQAPGNVVAMGGTSMSMPVLAAFAIMLAFGGIALLLDRVYPADRTRGGIVESFEQRAASSKRA
jgi:hypothetical protein